MLIAEVFIWHGLGGSVLTMFNDAGTLAATGFLFAYFMTVVAAPLYLRKLGELKPGNVAVAVAGFLLLMVPAVGLFYPLPSSRWTSSRRSSPPTCWPAEAGCSSSTGGCRGRSSDRGLA